MLENFEEILLFHFKKYPGMTPCDAVKLVYQSANGCGHLVSDPQKAMSMLKNEIDSIAPDDGAQLFVPIGGGYTRLDLHKAKALFIPEEKICEVFIESANSSLKTSFEEKIGILKNLSKEGKTPFSEAELSEYLSGYDGNAVSHSEKYRREYSPAYRVILENLAENLQ